MSLPRRRRRMCIDVRDQISRLAISACIEPGNVADTADWASTALTIIRRVTLIGLGCLGLLDLVLGFGMGIVHRGQFSRAGE